MQFALPSCHCLEIHVEMTTGAAILCIENVRLFIELLGLSGDSTTSVDMGLAN